jgi:alkanesulfonate monooxygenase SsuD/methylene tetrahydromethanopterin reductase-like flavin-dependent oxidoreductase (luciferase family)
MTIRLGFGLITCQRYPGDARSDEQLYVEAIDLAVEAERLGFDSVWVSEHHFVDDAYLPSLLPVCAAIVARTERITVGTGLLLAPLYEPIRLAEDAATVDLLSHGRFVLGIGLGWREEEFEVLRVPLSERAARLEGAVSACRQAWSGQPVRGGPGLSYPGPYVSPLPATDGGPPIWIGALSEAGVRRAGRIADGFMATEVTPESMAQQISWVGEELAAAGRDAGSFTFSVHLPTFAYEGDGQRAWRTIEPFHRYVSWKYEDMEHARRSGGPPQPPPDADGPAEAALRESIIFGTAEEVAARIRRFDEAAGGDLHFIARLYWPGMDFVLQKETMQMFAESVAPRLR